MRSDIQAFFLGASQSDAYTGTAGVSDAVGAQTRLVRVVVTTDAFIAIGKTASATTSDAFLPANTVEYFIINAGEKVSAVQVSAGGTLYITEMTK